MIELCVQLYTGFTYNTFSFAALNISFIETKLQLIAKLLVAFWGFEVPITALLTCYR